MEVLALLKDKTQTVCTVDSHLTVKDAICRMAGGGTHVVLVIENEEPVGTFSELDVFGICLKDRPTAFSQMMLQDVMTRKLTVAAPEDSIPSAIARMMEANITYLTVMKQNSILGILTLKDLMAHQLQSLADEIHHLKDYIADLHEAGQY